MLLCLDDAKRGTSHEEKLTKKTFSNSLIFLLKLKFKKTFTSQLFQIN